MHKTNQTNQQFMCQFVWHRRTPAFRVGVDIQFDHRTSANLNRKSRRSEVLKWIMISIYFDKISHVYRYNRDWALFR